MARDAYRNSEEATRARLVQLEIELENSQKRVVAIRLDIAATELRFPPDSRMGTRQVLAILGLGVDFFFFVTTRHRSVDLILISVVVGCVLFPFALPTDIRKLMKRRADRGKLEEAERTRRAIANQISEARSLLDVHVPDHATDESEREEEDEALRRKKI